MSSATLPNLLRDNWKYVLFILLVWVIATPSYQFKSLDVPQIEFPGNASEWNVSGSAINAVVGEESISVLPNEAKNTFLTKVYKLPERFSSNSFMKVDASVASTKVESAENNDDLVTSKRKPSVLVVRFESDNGKKISVHILTAFKSVSGSHQYSEMYSVPSFAEGAKVGLLLRRFDYSHTLDTLTLQYFTYSNAYLISVAVIVLFVLGCLLKYLKSSTSTSRVYDMLVTLVVGVMLVGILLPSKQLFKLINGLKSKLYVYSDSSYFSHVEPLQLYGHFIGFAGLAFVTLCLLKKSSENLVDTITKLVLFAIFTEIIQRHSVGRSSSFDDLFMDCIGALFGIVCWWILRKRNKSELA